MVRGYQGSGLRDRTGVLATAKHFAGYSETQGGRDASEADISPRKLRSWYLPPFERVARSEIRTFMLGYQSMDGVPITVNRWLISDVLKREWGFEGLLVTDWDNVGRMVWEQKVCADMVEAATLAIEAGNDVIMVTPGFFEAAQEAVARGHVQERQIDEAVRRVLRVKFELGLFEDPRPPDAARQSVVIGSELHRQLNLELARRSLVLLRNDGTLPLPVDGDARTLAVIGPNADDPDVTLGDWAGASGQVDWMPGGHPRETVQTVLDGLRAVAPARWSISHVRGAGIADIEWDPDARLPDGQPVPPKFFPEAPDPEEIARAVETAREADYAVVVVGDNIALAGEGRSTATLELQGGQLALLDAVAASGTPMIVVLIQSKPSVLPPSVMGAAALIEAFNPGMRGGQAVAELIFGLIEPSGRLPISFARHAGQQPTFYNQVRGQHGERYADLTQEPLFAFGEGLSYTSIDYSDLRLDSDDLDVSDTLRASVTLRNTGSRPAVETVQAYVSDLLTSATWAEEELKAFTQAQLAPGEQRRVAVEIPVHRCSMVDRHGRRVVEPGEFELRVGPNARDARQLARRFRVRPGAEG